MQHIIFLHVSISGSETRSISEVYQCPTSNHLDVSISLRYDWLIDNQNELFAHAQKNLNYVRSQFALLTKRVKGHRDKNFLKSDLWSIENENLAHDQKLTTNYGFGILVLIK